VAGGDAARPNGLPPESRQTATALTRVDDRPAQLVDALEWGRHVVDREIGKRAGVAGPPAALVQAKP